MMQAFLYAFVASSFGTLIPGALNLGAFYTSLNYNFRRALPFAFGAAVTQFIQTIISWVVGIKLNDYPFLMDSTRYLALLVFLALTIYFGVLASRAHQNLHPKTVLGKRPWLEASTITGLNFGFYGFWMWYTAYLTSSQTLAPDTATMIIFAIGVSCGSLILSITYAYLAQRFKEKAIAKVKYLYLFSAAIFAILTLSQVVMIVQPYLQ